MSGGIWFATVGVYPGLEGVALLLPTNRFRGFVAFFVTGGVDGPATLDMARREYEGQKDWIQVGVDCKLTPSSRDTNLTDRALIPVTETCVMRS